MELVQTIEQGELLPFLQEKPENKTLEVDSTEVSMLDELSNFIFTSKYARYNEDLKRRETWEETVNRVEDMHLKHYSHLTLEQKQDIRWAFNQVREKLVVPSMRSLQFGGKAIEAHHARIYNCAVRHVDSIRSFAEIFYLLLCGCGVGIGLSKFFLNRLSDLVSEGDKTGSVLTYVVEDTIEGWADSIEALLNCYFKNTAYTGRKIIFDYSKIRRKGAILKTSGGKAPGYHGLKNAHRKVKILLDHVIEHKGQKRLTAINAYDILMHTADAVLSGGIRRSATAIIFDKDDEEMMGSKALFSITPNRRGFQKDEEDGKYYGRVMHDGLHYDIDLSEWEYNSYLENGKVGWNKLFPHRARSNNSVLLLKNEVSEKEFAEIIERTRLWGEPGFVFADHPWQLFNPCFEVGFIPVTDDGVCGVQFCNLTSQNGAKIKNTEDFAKSVTAATILGSLQAGYTKFQYLGPASQKLTEQEALLGVSITGMMDSPDILLDPQLQRECAQLAINVNKVWAKILGINPAARITVLKPEGTASLFLGCAPGIHGWHDYNFVRRTQTNKIDPVYLHFKKFNPHMVEESVWSANKTDDVISWPVSVHKGAMVKSDLNAVKHLEIIKSTQQNWILAGTSSVNKKPISHNVSCTVEVMDNEWEEVTKYLYENRRFFAAVSFIPKLGDKLYAQAPNERVSTESDVKRFNALLKDYKKVDYTELVEYADETHFTQEVSCAGGACLL